MPMLIQELIPNIDLENYNVEFKGLIDSGKNKNGESKELIWLKTIVAFANTSGGTMYIGVEDKSHKILALDHKNVDKVTRLINTMIKTRIKPNIQYHLSTIKVPNTSPERYVVCLKVEKSNIIPVMLTAGDGLLGIYVRNFGESDPATPDQLKDMVYMSEQIPFDSPISDANYKKENFTKMFKIAKEKSVNITEKKLISIGFMDSHHKLAKGSLFFEDDIETSQTRVTANVWEGISKGSNIILAHQIFQNNILDVIQSSIDFVLNHSINGFKKEKTSRINYFSYPARSVTEAIVNAVGHRNYYIPGSQVEINIFRDRLEITSPGSLLGTQILKKEKNIAQIIPRRRNEVICHILEMCRYMEESGSGFDKIEEDYKNADNDHKPYISCDQQSFTLTLPDLLYKLGTQSFPDVYLEDKPKGKHDLKILSYCFNEKRSIKDITNFLSMTDSSYFRKSVIDRLVKDSLLTESISGRTKYYQTNQQKVFVKDNLMT